LIIIILKKRIPFLFLVAMSFIAIQLSAQTDTVINGKHYQIVPDKKTDDQEVKKKRKTPTDSTFILNNRKLTYYNNWLTAGGGFQQNLTYNRSAGFAGGLDFNFHITQQYFQVGAFITGESFGFYNNYQFHLGYGKRFENKDVHFAGFAGVSYSSGYGKVGDTVYTRPYKQPGLYAQIEAVKKITYDVGIGASFFVDYNSEQSILGGRLILYFSGAYKGKKYNDGKDSN
jgi:hypothetical protein